MFSILDHLKDLENLEEHHTWYKAECPVCKGKLKINKNNGSYACYTELCHEAKDSYGYNSIRQLLQPYRQRKTKLKKYNRIEIVTPYTFEPTDVDIKALFSNDFGANENSSYRENENIVYRYPEFEVVRTPAKDIFLRHIEGRLGIPTVLNYPYVYPSIERPGSYIAGIVEGEKCVDICVKNSMWAYTIPCFGFNGVGTTVLATLMKNNGVDKVVIFADNDKTGYKKAAKLERALWSVEIQTCLVKFEDQDDGYDVGDFLEENSCEMLVRKLRGKM